MSNQHIIEYCNHRSQCRDKGCKALAIISRPDPDDVAYADAVHCGRYKPEEGTCDGGTEVVLTGAWK